MSRTYRTEAKRIDCNCGAEVDEIYANDPIREDRAPDRLCRCWCNPKYDYAKYNRKRTKLRWKEAPKFFRTIRNRSFRAKCRHEMKNNRYDCMPINKNTVKYDWW